MTPTNGGHPAGGRDQHRRREVVHVHEAPTYTKQTTKLSNFSRTPECLDIATQDTIAIIAAGRRVRVQAPKLKCGIQTAIIYNLWTAALKFYPHVHTLRIVVFLCCSCSNNRGVSYRFLRFLFGGNWGRGVISPAQAYYLTYRKNVSPECRNYVT